MKSFFIVSTYYQLLSEWIYIPSILTTIENVPVRFDYIFFQCTGSDEQLGKFIYNALETATGSFVLLYEWVLQWQKKMGPFLTSQEKEKIDKCKKQVGIQDGSLSRKQNSSFDW